MKIQDPVESYHSITMGSDECQVVYIKKEQESAKKAALTLSRSSINTGVSGNELTNMNVSAFNNGSSLPPHTSKSLSHFLKTFLESFVNNT